jgi:hypothetical protein
MPWKTSKMASEIWKFPSFAAVPTDNASSGIVLWGSTITRIHYRCKFKGKGKIHPGRSHEVPEWEKRYRSTLSLTSALD